MKDIDYMWWIFVWGIIIISGILLVGLIWLLIDLITNPNNIQNMTCPELLDVIKTNANSTVTGYATPVESWIAKECWK